MADPTLSAPRFVGKSIGRKENRRFLTGRGQYVDDHVVPGMLHAAFLRSPMARAKLLSIDVEAARALPGVYAVYTAKELNGQFQPLKYIFGGTDPIGLDYVLARDEVTYVGDPIAIVVAEDRYIAEDAAELIDIDYDPIDPVVTIDNAKAMGPALPGHSDNVAVNLHVVLPGAEEAFAEAAQVVTGRLAQGRVAPTPIEARGIISDPRMDGQLEIHMTSQNPHQAKAYIADMLGMPENHVRIISPDIGGAFGQKYCFGRDLLATVGASRLLHRPVKWIEDRGEALLAGGHSRTERLSLDMAFDENGKILATSLGFEDAIGADPMTNPSGNGQLAMLFHTGAYAVPTVKADIDVFFSNTCGIIPYRGPWAGETLIREITIDKAARELGIDPVELRRRNIFTQQPHTLPMGQVIDGVTPRECLDLAVDAIDYEAFRAEQAAARLEGRFIGIGTAVYIEPCAISSGGNSSDTAAIRLEPSGQVTATMTCHSQGHSVETTMAQVIADEIGVDVEDVTILFGDTNAIGFGAGAGGSRQALVSGGAAKVAATMLRDKILLIANHFLQTPIDELRLEGGKVVSTVASGPSITLKEVGQAAYLDPGSLPEGAGAGVEAQYRFVPPMFSYSNAAHACTVEVDVATGLVKFLRYVVAEDCGVMLNPAVVEGQIAGGVIQAMGNVLWEEQHYDEYGNPSASTFKDYAMPLATDAPKIEYLHLCTPSDTPTGAKGVGEGGAIVGPPAIYNAIMDALAPFNVTLEQLPLTPARIVAALQEAENGDVAG
jgi:carbon-monoxide dehydrogenase large subunit